MPLALDSRYCGTVYIIECRGRIVAGKELESLEEALDLGFRGFTRLVLHVNEVDRLDSTGMGLLVRYAARARRRGGDLRLAAPPPFVANLLVVTRLSTILQIYPTEEAAILSFLKEHPVGDAQQRHGPRVLLLDQSPDLCAFVRTVLQQHGFEVKSTIRFRDARILLQVDEVEYILLGPDASRHDPDAALATLKALAPLAAGLHLGADFKQRDAHEATQALLQMFHISAG